MPAIAIFLPLLIAYASFVPLFLRDKAYIKTKTPHVAAAVIVLITNALLMIMFMDFGAALSFTGIKLAATLLLSAGLSVIFGLIYWTLALRHDHTRVALALFAALCILISLFAEATVFNHKFWQTHGYTPVDVTEKILEDSMLSPADEEKYPSDAYEFDGAPTLILNDVGMHVDNVFIDAEAYNDYGEEELLIVTVKFSDDANSESFISTSAQETIHTVKTSQYLELQPSGDVHTLKLSLSTAKGTHFFINKIIFNQPHPFVFSIIRVLVVALIIFVIGLLRPKGKVWSYIFTGSKKQMLIILAVLVLQMLLLISLTTLNPIFMNRSGSSAHHAQYHQLTDAILDGRLYLDEEPPEYLSELENPYDYSERTEAKRETGESYYWDAAYFEGKYYVYFGIVPVLLLYLPYRVITDVHLPHFVAIAICLCLFALGAFLLIARIIKRYFREGKIPLVAYLLASLIFVNASGAVFIAKRPDFYSVPIISALAFTVFGLYFWIGSIKEGGRVSIVPAFLGSLCMALVAGCRPQLLVASAFVFVIYWNCVFRDRTVFSKKGLGATLALILPYLLVAAFIMWYNYARFGSPFDFGANYNLTTNDMTRRGFRVERLGLAFFTYLFQPPNITADFPFINGTVIESNYLGTTITEPVFGGIFAVIPLIWILALLPRKARQMKKNHLAFVILGVVLCVFIALFDAQGAGLLGRYVSDFAFLALLSAVFFTFFTYSTADGQGTLNLNSFMRASFLASAAYCFLIVFAVYSVEIYYYNPDLFIRASELVQFWG